MFQKKIQPQGVILVQSIYLSEKNDDLAVQYEDAHV